MAASVAWDASTGTYTDSERSTATQWAYVFDGLSVVCYASLYAITVTQWSDLQFKATALGRYDFVRAVDGHSASDSFKFFYLTLSMVRRVLWWGLHCDMV